ncbi:Protein of uncharacterised function (DUF3558) [Mycobacteroides abscessus subsp. abscessus]|uniref:Protein of uncharacterized function (DUF3558) n=3 Tax=Mycobacteroides abscessus TaxID=36809 RepID=A0AB38D4N1_9MYCO|nr:DUF3558 domain-containing protein [Mycobacteroides abscessus]MBE5455254.1 hypothetical protein [Mycobacteroides abscessus]CPR80782.1 Hypothetical protein ERS075499_01633 [Mycobacteroides abscessus]CPS93696.1 Hypothetical protein ERS075520_02782 [Mycobacteroides abscessus]CPS94264.1 Hypothetical protein ERS075521_02853 [Mycobacteroides abscessus]CPT26958.1 Hypothetical protein ERS075523_04487 [Mycobacteroides abscessus]
MQTTRVVMDVAAVSRPKMLRMAIGAVLTMLLTGCSSTISGSGTTSISDSDAPSQPTSTTEHTSAKFDPCTDIPANVIAQLQLDNGTPRPDSQNGGEIKNVFCMYHSRGDYYLTVAASNYTLDMLRKADNYWGFQDLEIGGRPALFGYRTPEPSVDSCALNIAASSGVYGVMVGTARHSFAPYPDCLTAARTNAEALVSYFPQ